MLYPDPDSMNLDPKHWKKLKKVHVLECWMFFLGGLKASPVAVRPSIRPRDKN